MSLTHYIAIRSVLDYEIETNRENVVLPQVISILVDKGADLEEDSYTEIRETVNTVAASASNGKTGVPLAKIFTSLITTPKGISTLTTLGIMISQSGIIAEIVGTTANGTAGWLKKILK